ncbi:MAG: SDR family oxidoreductase [Candidatus Brocadiae bacterium]|nr:SDR family oxidoreductase [Candidatus Brocadiia bacterium]
MRPESARRGAIVTGGASGIGAVTAALLRDAGYEVVTVDLLAAADVKGDVREPGTAKRALEALTTPPGVLVNCAGITKGGLVEKTSLEDWNLVVGVDLTGAFVFTQAVAPAMALAGGGRIVNVASTLALRARRGTSAYAAAKAGLIGFTRACARDYGRSGINVNAVAPGLVETKLSEQIPAETRARLIEETALGRSAKPEDVAEVILFLCSPASRHITGECIRVDGGQLA